MSDVRQCSRDMLICLTGHMHTRVARELALTDIEVVDSAEA